MSTRMYIGNLPFTFTSADLQQVFSDYGPVKFAQVIVDRETGRSRGFGFVEMESPDAYRNALSNANGRDVGGRQITVTEARERAPREGGGGGGGGERRGPRSGGPPQGDRGFAPRGPGDASGLGGGGRSNRAPRGERPGGRSEGRWNDAGGRGGDDQGRRRWRDRGEGGARGERDMDDARGSRRQRFEDLGDEEY